MWTHLYLLFNSSVHSSRHYLWTLIPTLYWSSSGWSWNLPRGNSMGELHLSDPPWGYRALEAITQHWWEEIAERPKWVLIFESDRGPLKGYCISAINGCNVKLLYCANHWQMVIVIYDHSSWLSIHVLLVLQMLGYYVRKCCVKCKYNFENLCWSGYHGLLLKIKPVIVHFFRP